MITKRSAIQWAKGEQLIPRNNGGKSKRRARKREVGSGTTKAFVTRKGSLRIPAIGYREAGIYSCMGKFLQNTSGNYISHPNPDLGFDHLHNVISEKIQIYFL